MVDISCKECIHYKVCPNGKEESKGLRMCDAFLPKKQYGKWEETGTGEHICSVCGLSPIIGYYCACEILSDYCPHCGARLFKKMSL